MSTQQRPSATKQRWSDFLLAWTLSAVHGIIMGLTLGTLPVMLRPKVSLMELGLFAAVALPDATQFLWMPRATSPKKRKAILVICCFLLAMDCIYSAAHVERGIQNGDVWTVLCHVLLLVLLAAAVQGMHEMWLVHGSRVNAARMLGSNMGALFAFVCFLILQNPQRLIQFLRPLRLHSPGPYLTLMTLMNALGYLLLFLCSWILLAPMPAGVERSSEEVAVNAGSMGGLGWVMLMGRLPFAAVEGLMLMKVLDKGFPVDVLAIVKGLECLPGLFSGIFVLHGLPAHRRHLTWILAYFSRILVGGGLTYFLTLLPDFRALPQDLSLLMVYAVLSCALVFMGNLLLTIQCLWIEEETMTCPVLRRRRIGMSTLSSSLMRMVVLCLSDVLSHRVCFRQEQQFLDVPCPIPPPFGILANNLCTDSGGICLVMSDGFPLISYTSLALGIGLGPLLYRFMTNAPRHKRETS